MAAAASGIGGCAPAPIASRSSGAACAGDVVLRGEDAVAALARCRVIDGSVSVTGGALASLAALDGLRAITGDLRIGPSAALAAVDGFASLAEVGGSLVMDTNLEAQGAYFPALRRVGGDVVVARNPALAGVTLPVLERVGGGVEIAGNAALEWLDMPALRDVGGRVRIADNPRLAVRHGAPTRLDPWPSGTVGT